MDSALVESASQLYLGRWRRLVSTTNWEKGRIIQEWRQALIEQEAPNSDYSDEAWSQIAGQVTPQHVGRLRRVFERFGATHEQYQHLYWSHFQAVLDWHDAEMWLEGAVQNGWSISQMRQARWEATGAIASDRDAALAADDAPWDEDGETTGEVVTGALAAVRPLDRGSRTDGEADDDSGSAEHYDAGAMEPQLDSNESDRADSREQVRPFAALPSLPADVGDAFESFKLCILRHKLSGWREISCDDLVASLQALVQFALLR